MTVSSHQDLGCLSPRARRLALLSITYALWLAACNLISTPTSRLLGVETMLLSEVYAI